MKSNYQQWTRYATLLCVVSVLTGCATGTDYYTPPAAQQPTKPETVNEQAKHNRTYHFPSTRPATGNSVVIFEPKYLMWGAYDANGYLVKEGPASGGNDYCSDLRQPCRTPSGTFKVYRKQGPECKSSIFPLGKGGAPMPYCMHFNGGYAMHGSYDVAAYNASHGCIRILPEDAKWLSENFVRIGTTIIVEPYAY